MVQLTVWLWAGGLAVGVFAAHWGAERFAKPLQKLRRQWGLTAAAGGAVVGLAGAGLAVLAGGTYLAVRATENIAAAFGISNLLGGLFITALIAATPEIFATWSVVRSGQVTAGTTSVLGDHAVTMTVAFVPLALTTVPVENFHLYWVNLAFVAMMPAAYAALLHFGTAEHGFKRWQVTVLDGIYVLYVAVIAFWVLNLV